MFPFKGIWDPRDTRMESERQRERKRGREGGREGEREKKKRKEGKERKRKEQEGRKEGKYINRSSKPHSHSQFNQSYIMFFPSLGQWFLKILVVKKNETGHFGGLLWSFSCDPWVPSCNLHKPNALQNSHPKELESCTYGIETHKWVITLRNSPCTSHHIPQEMCNAAQVSATVAASKGTQVAQSLLCV